MLGANRALAALRAGGHPGGICLDAGDLAGDTADRLAIHPGHALDLALTGSALIATFFTLVPYMLCSLAELLLGRGNQARGRDVVLASLAFALSLWATAGAGRDTLYWGTLLMLAGLPLYALQKWSHADGARA